MIWVVYDYRHPTLLLDRRIRRCQATVCVRVSLRAYPALEVNDLVQWVVCDSSACSMQHLRQHSRHGATCPLSDVLPRTMRGQPTRQLASGAHIQMAATAVTAPTRITPHKQIHCTCMESAYLADAASETRTWDQCCSWSDCMSASRHVAAERAAQSSAGRPDFLKRQALMHDGWHRSLTAAGSSTPCRLAIISATQCHRSKRGTLSRIISKLFSISLR